MRGVAVLGRDPRTDVLTQNSQVSFGQLLARVKAHLQVQARTRRFIQRVRHGKCLQPRHHPLVLAQRAGELRIPRQHGATCGPIPEQRTPHSLLTCACTKSTAVRSVGIEAEGASQRNQFLLSQSRGAAVHVRERSAGTR
jgi:hypothetical protein